MSALTVREVKAALSAVKPTVGLTSTIAVLGGVAFEGDAIRSTDMSAQSVAPLATGVRAVIPFQPLARAINGGYADEPVRFTARAKAVGVKVGPLEHLIPTRPLNDFPEPRAPFEDPVTVTLDTEAVAALAAVAQVASGDETRPALTHVKLELGAESIVATATDSYRIHFVRVPAETSTLTGDNELHVLVPWRRIVKLKVPLELTADATSIGDEGSPGRYGEYVPVRAYAIRQGEVVVSGRGGEGPFPEWRKLLPEVRESDVGGIDLPEDTHETLVRFGKVAGGRNRPAVLALRRRAKRLQMSWGDHSDTTITATVPLAEPWGKEAYAMGFNPQFMAEALAFGGHHVRLIAPERPAVFNGDSPDRWALLMPVRLS